MKKNILKLDQLKVKSFITNLGVETEKTLKGGSLVPDPIGDNDDTLDFHCGKGGSAICTLGCSNIIVC